MYWADSTGRRNTSIFGGVRWGTGSARLEVRGGNRRSTVSAIVPTAEDSLSLSGTDDEYDGIEYDGLPVKCGMLAISLLCNSFEVTDCKDTCSDTDAVGVIGVNDYVVDVQAPFGGVKA